MDFHLLLAREELLLRRHSLRLIFDLGHDKEEIPLRIPLLILNFIKLILSLISLDLNPYPFFRPLLEVMNRSFLTHSLKTREN